MEMVNIVILDSNERKNNTDNLKFELIQNVKFCKICGTKENNITRLCSICHNKEFLEGDIAATIAGYVELDKKGLIKKYYNKVTDRRFSAVNMNNKRTVFQLLVRTGLVQFDDREMERLIQKIMWKKF